MAGQKSWIFSADFETTTDPTDCRVWGWGICDVMTATSPFDVKIGGGIDDFLDHLSRVTSITYFHNLKFDGSFIIDKLFRLGFRHVSDSPRRGEYSTLISNMGQFYSITIKWANGKKTELRDSLKKLPMKLARVATSFKLDEVKGKIAYDEFRPVGHVPTRDERTYIASDVLIIAKALRVQFEQGMTRLTVGSDSLNEFKAIMGKQVFAKTFPVLASVIDADIRKAYRGGFTYADERFKGKRTCPGRVYDVNSLYPSVMYDRILPYGEPMWHEGLPPISKQYPLFTVSITFTAKLKKNHIPCIQAKNVFKSINAEYLKVIKEPITLTCTNIDLALWEDHYDMDILSYNGGYSFHGVAGMFTKFIEKWSKIKAANEGGLREIAKLFLNALYGKFATNPNVTPKIPVMDWDKDYVKLVLGPEEMRDPVYTPGGVFITAYARDVTIRTAQEHYDTFAYADTDSLHLLREDDPPGLDIDPKRLGAWKHEYNFESAIFIRAKAYIEQKYPSPPFVTGDFVTHVAGLPDAVADKMTFADIVDKREFTGKLVPRRVPGGIVLADAGFTLNM